MKQVEKVVGVSVNDLKIAIPAIKEAYSRLLKDYNEQTHPKIKLLDSFIVFCLMTFVIQLLYRLRVGRDPFNSHLAGVYCSLG